MFCRHCGKQIQDDSKFCTECGGILEEVVLLSPSQESSVPASAPMEAMLPNKSTTRTIAILILIAILIMVSIVVAIKIMEPEEEWKGAEVEVWVHTVTKYGADNVPNEPYVVEVWYSEGIIFHVNMSDLQRDWVQTPNIKRVDWYSGTTGSDGKDVFYLTIDTEGFYLFCIVAGTDRWAAEEVWIDENVHEVDIGPLIQEVPEEF